MNKRVLVQKCFLYSWAGSFLLYCDIKVCSLIQKGKLGNTVINTKSNKKCVSLWKPLIELIR